MNFGIMDVEAVKDSGVVTFSIRRANKTALLTLGEAEALRDHLTKCVTQLKEASASVSSSEASSEQPEDDDITTILERDEL